MWILSVPLVLVGIHLGLLIHLFVAEQKTIATPTAKPELQDPFTDTTWEPPQPQKQ